MMTILTDRVGRTMAAACVLAVLGGCRQKTERTVAVITAHHICQSCDREVCSVTDTVAFYGLTRYSVNRSLKSRGFDLDARIVAERLRRGERSVSLDTRDTLCDSCRPAP